MTGSRRGGGDAWSKGVQRGCPVESHMREAGIRKLDCTSMMIIDRV